MSPSGQLPAQDWEILASPGHVTGKRTAALMRRLFLPACVALIVSIVAAQQAIIKPAPALPQWVQDGIPSFDPATFTKIPGGGTATWQFSYLAGLSPQPGLSARDFKALIDAAMTDVAQFADNTQLWQAVANLDKQPLVTRPQKLFGSNAGKLASGMIALPQGYRPGGGLWVVSWVEGRLTWAELGAPGCVLLMGSAETGRAVGCVPAAPGLLLEKAYGTERFALFRPAPASTTARPTP